MNLIVWTVFTIEVLLSQNDLSETLNTMKVINKGDDTDVKNTLK